MTENTSQPRHWWDSAEQETAYLHWIRGEPRTQIQLAFRNHWTLFQELISEQETQGKRCIELGCGRGTISMYFADAGWECTLVDLSRTVLSAAKEAFTKEGLDAQFVEGDATDTKLQDESYDVCVSIGLLEHIPDLKKALAEQVRLLRTGGIMLAYVVPESNPESQQGCDWINDIFKSYWLLAGGEESDQVKPDIYRSDANSAEYLNLLSTMEIKEVKTSGVYPLPMLSPSIDFPFTLNPPIIEKRLTDHFKAMLAARGEETATHPWLCEESYGQAFLVWGRKV